MLRQPSTVNPIDPDDSSTADSSTLQRDVQETSKQLSELRADTNAYPTQFVDTLLEFASRSNTSDVHLQPVATGIEIRFRHDGVLQKLGEFQDGKDASIITRLKVLSDLLTYQNDLPQEGRVVAPKATAEVRVSTFPTLYGERAVLRFFGQTQLLTQLQDLGHTPEVTQAINDTLAETSGAVLITGPAGSGKSTTLYACVRKIVRAAGGNRSILSIEDPIEVPVPGVAQSQVNAAGRFDLNTGLRSLLRQDPEVIMIGEIRDPLTAEIAIQACLTGQLMLTTFHSDSAATAISRLLDMGIEPYLLRSGVIGILSQRLLRVLCECGEQSRDQNQFCGLPIDECRVPRGCDVCNHTGYRGRILISEFLSLKDSSLADQLLDTKDSRAIYRIAVENGMKSLWERATDLVREKVTSPSEVRRVLGMSMRV
ncbi:MAG: GspE/PulE family protein [Pirellulaceae bacterium]